MRKLRSLALAGLVALLASVTPAYADHPYEADADMVARGYASMADCPKVPHYPAITSVGLDHLKLIASAAPQDRPLRGGDVIQIPGRVLWPNGRPVRGHADSDVASIMWNKNLPRDGEGNLLQPELWRPVCADGDGIQEGGIILWKLDIPLAPDGITARSGPVFDFAVADWKGDFVLDVAIPWRIVWPGEEGLTIELSVTVIAVDRELLSQGKPAVGSHQFTAPLTIYPGDARGTY